MFVSLGGAESDAATRADGPSAGSRLPSVAVSRAPEVLMRSATFTVVITASALLAAAPMHAQLRANAGVVAGNAQFGPQFQCATSGPTIGPPWFAGLTLPTEGIAACGLSGV